MEPETCRKLAEREACRPEHIFYNPTTKQCKCYRETSCCPDCVLAREPGAQGFREYTLL